MSFTSETRERSRPILPLAGMVDILFLLLVFFIVTSTLREQEAAIDLELTPAESAQAEAGGAHPTISITPATAAEGKVHWGGPGGTAITLAELRTKLQTLVEKFPNETVVVRTDGEVEHRMFVRVYDMAREAGVGVLKMATTKPQASDGSAGSP